VIAGRPGEEYGSFFNATFVNCNLISEGIEAPSHCSEWLLFMSVHRTPIHEANRGLNQFDKRPGA
jgi:hypothetical protein